MEKNRHIETNPWLTQIAKESTVSWTLGVHSQTEAQEAKTDLCRNSSDESIRDEGLTAEVSPETRFCRITPQCPTFFSAAVSNTITNSSLVGKGWFWLAGHSPLSGEPRKKLKAGTRRQELKQRPLRNKKLLISLLPDSQSAAIFILLRLTFPGVHCPRWAEPFSTN